MKSTEIKQNRLYDEFAHLWTLVSNPADYAEEAANCRRVLRDKLGEGRHEILELGVGGGNNLSHLTADFKATAVDISEKMLANSRKLNPEVEHFVGDMRTVRLGRTFKAVLIQDAINYMQTEDDLRAAFATAREHLRPGGVLVTSPDYFLETFEDGVVRHRKQSEEKIELTYIEYDYDLDLADSKFEAIAFYLIREKGQLRVELDRHVLGLFALKTWLELMEEAGFVVEKYDCDVSDVRRQSFLLVGVKK
ncbi:MAG: class I SAM-dependent methyltransferase [candidate division Zixibacteria bacterium]|nr:class I SAM-dependent methyltransferase [candidate division Zixibacteria bacterium]